MHVVYDLGIFNTQTIVTFELLNGTSFWLLFIEMVEEILSSQSVFLVLVAASFH